MCASQSIYREVYRVVYGTSIPDINNSGREQIKVRMVDVVASAKLGASRENTNVPIVEGGILKDECDKAFWCAFSVFRDKAYFAAMRKNNQLNYIKEREAKFKCGNQKPRAHIEL